MWRIVAVDSALLNGVSEHLMLMKGKMLRPTLLLLSSEVDGAAEPRAASYAAVVELIHLATLVHDDADNTLDTSTSHFYNVALSPDGTRIAATTNNHPNGVLLAILKVGN